MITVIVLLILAAISISMLTGNNGTIGRAGEAKERAEKEDARELIETEVLKSFDKFGDFRLSKLKTNLTKINADVTSIEDIMQEDALSGKIILNGYVFYVDKNERVLDYNGPEKAPTPEQSTTGNIYGVYDTVGGIFEYVAGYIPNEKSAYGNQFASTDGTKNNKNESTPYSTVYKYNKDSDSNTNNYAVNLNKVFGDAICETSTAGDGSTAWHSSHSRFVNSSYPFFKRGGYFNFSVAGSFYFYYYNGGAHDNYGSRVVCVVK